MKPKALARTIETPENGRHLQGRPIRDSAGRFGGPPSSVLTRSAFVLVLALGPAGPLAGCSSSSSPVADTDASVTDTDASDSGSLPDGDAGPPDGFVAPTAPTCDISGTSYENGAVNPANACEVCQSYVSTSTWSSTADGTSCGSGQVCHLGTCGAGCLIDGHYAGAGAVNPAGTCQTCQPSTSTTAWSGCGAGETCNAGSCMPGCMVGGTFYAPGEGNDAGELCNNGAMTPGCAIEGTIYAPGEASPTNACMTCQPTVSMSFWTMSANGANCGVGQVCMYGGCTPGCFVDGAVYAADTVNPANLCQSCQPAASTTSWSSLADGAACEKSVCKAGNCIAMGGGPTQCYIGGPPNGYMAAPGLNPNDACQSCDLAKSLTSWILATDGAACGNSQVCTSGICGTQCLIGGTTYASDSLNAGNACQSCQPGKSITAWTTLAEGTGCGTNATCTAGSCVSRCVIGSNTYTTGALNPANPCQSCQPATSSTGWSSTAEGTKCANGSLCKQGTCTWGACFIDGKVYSLHDHNPDNFCQTCEGTTTSQVTWGRPWGTIACSLPGSLPGSNGGVCNNNQICLPGCTTPSRYYYAGETDQFGCGICDPTQSTVSLSANGTIETECVVGQRCLANHTCGVPIRCTKTVTSVLDLTLPAGSPSLYVTYSMVGGGGGGSHYSVYVDTPVRRRGDSGTQSSGHFWLRSGNHLQAYVGGGGGAGSFYFSPASGTTSGSREAFGDPFGGGGGAGRIGGSGGAYGGGGGGGSSAVLVDGVLQAFAAGGRGADNAGYQPILTTYGLDLPCKLSGGDGGTDGGGTAGCASGCCEPGTALKGGNGYGCEFYMSVFKPYTFDLATCQPGSTTATEFGGNQADSVGWWNGSMGGGGYGKGGQSTVSYCGAGLGATDFAGTAAPNFDVPAVLPTAAGAGGAPVGGCPALGGNGGLVVLTYLSPTGICSL